MLFQALDGGGPVIPTPLDCLVEQLFKPHALAWMDVIADVAPLAYPCAMAEKSEVAASPVPAN